MEASFGRVGIGICADNHLASHLRRMRAADVDLLLMPHVWPIPQHTGHGVTESDLREAREHVAELPAIYARSMGIPAVFVNQVGAMTRMSGLLGRLMDPARFALGGGALLGSPIVAARAQIVRRDFISGRPVLEDVVLVPSPLPEWSSAGAFTRAAKRMLRLSRQRLSCSLRSISSSERPTSFVSM